MFFTALALNLMLRSQSHENLVEGGCTIYSVSSLVTLPLGRTGSPWQCALPL